MAVEPLLDRYKTGLEYIAGLYKIMAEDYGSRLVGSGPKYTPKDLINSLGKDLSKVSLDLQEMLKVLELKDYKRDKSADAAYLASLSIGHHVTFSEGGVGVGVRAGEGIIVATRNGGRSIMIEYYPFKYAMYILTLIWNEDTGKWNYSVNMDEWEKSVIDIKGEAVYMVTVNEEPQWKGSEIRLIYDRKDVKAGDFAIVIDENGKVEFRFILERPLDVIQAAENGNVVYISPYETTRDRPFNMYIWSDTDKIWKRRATENDRLLAIEPGKYTIVFTRVIPKV